MGGGEQGERWDDGLVLDGRVLTLNERQQPWESMLVANLANERPAQERPSSCAFSVIPQGFTVHRHTSLALPSLSHVSLFLPSILNGV